MNMLVDVTAGSVILGRTCNGLLQIGSEIETEIRVNLYGARSAGDSRPFVSIELHARNA